MGRSKAKNGGGAEAAVTRNDSPPVIGGQSDGAHLFDSLPALWEHQLAHRQEYYAANNDWWEDGGYGGANDDEAMIGDEGSSDDVEHSLRFLHAALERCPRVKRAHAMDGGAGVGRVTKQVLLKVFDTVHLVEGSDALSKYSRKYLGNKRAQRCTFTHARLEDFIPTPGAHDLIWLQWVLQYLIDQDVVSFLSRCAQSLVAGRGIIIIKENRPAWRGKASRFEFDTPQGPNARFDITRPDAHHAWLFAQAGLSVLHSEHHDETTSWLLVPSGGERSERATSLQ